MANKIELIETLYQNDKSIEKLIVSTIAAEDILNRIAAFIPYSKSIQ